MLGRTEAEIRAAGPVRGGGRDRPAPGPGNRGAGGARATCARNSPSCARTARSSPPKCARRSSSTPKVAREPASTVRDLTESKRAEDRLRLIADAGAVLGSTSRIGGNAARLDPADRAADGRLLRRRPRRRRRASPRHRLAPRPVPGALAHGGRLARAPDSGRTRGSTRRRARGRQSSLPVVDERGCAGSPRDEAHLAMLRVNAPRSMIMVPLVGRGGVIGVLTLAIDRRGPALRARPTSPPRAPSPTAPRSRWRTRASTSRWWPRSDCGTRC